MMGLEGTGVACGGASHPWASQATPHGAPHGLATGRATAGRMSPCRACHGEMIPPRGKKDKNAENALCAIFGTACPMGRALSGATRTGKFKWVLNEVFGFEGHGGKEWLATD